MTKIKFKGVPGEKHEAINMFGVEFPAGEAIDVSGLPPKQIEKLRNHPHFAAEEAAEDDSSNLRRASLIQKAEASGIKVDGRWSDERLAEEMKSHKAK